MAQAQAVLTDIDGHHAPVKMSQQPVNVGLQIPTVSDAGSGWVSASEAPI